MPHVAAGTCRSPAASVSIYPGLPQPLGEPVVSVSGRVFIQSSKNIKNGNKSVLTQAALTTAMWYKTFRRSFPIKITSLHNPLACSYLPARNLCSFITKSSSAGKKIIRCYIIYPDN